MRTLLSMLLLTALVLWLSTPVGAAPCPTPITGDMTLGSDCDGNIVIEADNITLNCDGHFVTGPGAGGAGIALVGRGGVTVENCIVTMFADGFSVRGSRANVFRQNLVLRNTDEGFDVEQSIGNIFIQNIVRENGSDGFDLEDSHANFFGDNEVKHNGVNGIEFDGCNNNVLERNTANDNGQHGISLDRSGGNFFDRNIANGNVRRGFQIITQNNDNRFIANIACQNREIDAAQGGSVRNWFLENGFCTASGIGYIP